MKKIKPHVNTYCTFCKLDGIMKSRAVWRISYHKEVACEDHKYELQNMEINYREHDGIYSEADYQTWLKL